MCGIFGCLCEGAPKVLLEGLKRLEYRGYDSVGIALINGDELFVEKNKGKIDEFILGLDEARLKGEIGVGHTRWATHGAPSKENAHPHLDCSKRIAVVHNGVLENFLQIKEELLKKGHIFSSRTDSEVIPHLVEEYLNEGLTLKEALVKSMERVKGSAAIAMISTVEPERIYCYRRESPLIVGISERGVFCASDIPAIMPYTRRVMVVPDDRLVVLERGSIQIEDLRGVMYKTEFTEVTWDLELAEKGGYPHFMIKEIFEQPRAIRDTLKIPTIFLDKAARLLTGRIYLTGSGTSYHACLSTSYTASDLVGIEMRPMISSEFADALLSLESSTVIAVSQSGETADTLNAVKHAKSKGAKILGITNTLGSSITTLSDAYICTQSGPEIGVAATKTFLTQLVALDLLLLRLGLISGRLSESAHRSITHELEALPGMVEQILRRADKIRDLALKYSKKENAFFLGRGANVATALEGALKLKEISYIHAEGYPAGESKHGPISLIEPNFLCVFIAPRDRTRERIIGNIMEMKARGAEVFSVITEGDDELKEISDEYFEVPRANEILYPIICTVPLQLLAYYAATFRGFDPDRPRNLAKSVTVL
ncbi:MAG: glutamine--fructose-6-phosphate transaminase (isomerizing) [Candidatus Methanomethyliaceae archaeon]|nr:glutamine--fructose-6-phosphate transaminase (isomerizing) [Candidatus Methanomethyliaceae archaeon]